MKKKKECFSKFIIGDDDLEYDYMIKTILLYLNSHEESKPMLVMSKRLSTPALAMSLQKIASESNIPDSKIQSLTQKISLFGAEHEYQQSLFFTSECHDFLDFCAGVEGKYQFIVVDHLENYCQNLADDGEMHETFRVANFLGNATGQSDCLIGLQPPSENDFSKFGQRFDLNFYDV